MSELRSSEFPFAYKHNLRIYHLPNGKNVLRLQDIYEMVQAIENKNAKDETTCMLQFGVPKRQPRKIAQNLHEKLGLSSKNVFDSGFGFVAVTSEACNRIAEFYKIGAWFCFDDASEEYIKQEKAEIKTKRKQTKKKRQKNEQNHR